MPAKRKVKKLSLTERAYCKIKDSITKGVFKPDDILLETEMAEKLGMSRTPIREAFLRLENEGFVKTYPKNGVIVSKLGISDIMQISQVRASLEGMAARLACGKVNMNRLAEIEGFLINECKCLDNDIILEKSYAYGNMLHEEILRAAGNPIIFKYVGTMRQQLQRIQVFSRNAPGRGELNLKEHLAILEALKENNPDQAEKKMREHIMNVQDDVTAMLKAGMGIFSVE